MNLSRVYKNSQYCSNLPSAKRFPNHGSCDKCTVFIREEILKCLSSGAIRVWGRVGMVSPPHLILPLTVEPRKPRLCVDARFLNLWMKDAPFSLDKMKDAPFSLDKITDVPRYVYHFGFEWGGLWFVCRTLPFGWKISPCIYHSTGLAVPSFLHDLGIPCSLYIDDLLNGELLTQSGPWSVLHSDRVEEFHFKVAQASIFVVLSVSVELGYTIGISKSVLHPTTSLDYLGFVVDSQSQSFLVPQRTIISWVLLREEIFARHTFVDVKTLQRFQGKCISLSLAVPAAKLSASSNGQVFLSPGLGEEIIHWWFLDSWKDCVPWRDEKHLRHSVSSNASGHGWGGVLHLSSGDRVLGDYWQESQRT